MSFRNRARLRLVSLVAAAIVSTTLVGRAELPEWVRNIEGTGGAARHALSHRADAGRSGRRAQIAGRGLRGPEQSHRSRRRRGAVRAARACGGREAGSGRGGSGVDGFFARRQGCRGRTARAREFLPSTPAVAEGSGHARCCRAGAGCTGRSPAAAERAPAVADVRTHLRADRHTAAARQPSPRRSIAPGWRNIRRIRNPTIACSSFSSRAIGPRMRRRCSRAITPRSQPMRRGC